MQSRICRCFLFGVAVLFISCTGGNVTSVREDDTGYGYGGGATVRSYTEIENRVLSLSGDFFNVEVLQTVACGQEACDIFRVIFNENQPDTKQVLLIGAIHGNEPAGANALLRLLEDMNNAPDRYAGFTITIIPVLNPWGWVHNSRTNARGVDLNNDFGLFQAPETQAFAHHPARLKYDLVMDLHEAGQAAHFICCYGDKMRDACTTFSKTFKQKGYVLDSTYQDILSQTNAGVMSIPVWMVNLSRLSDSIALSHYFYLRDDAAVVTLESSMKFDLESRVRFHLDVIRFFLEMYSVKS